jgi:8-oxo-dGTP diphosphatase
MRSERGGPFPVGKADEEDRMGEVAATPKAQKLAAGSIDARRGIDFIGVTVVFFCHDGKGRLLMHRRSQNCRDEHGRWDVGGGAMEHGESFEEAVIREVGEEYCVSPKRLQYVQAKNIIRQNGDIKTHWIALLFAVEVDPSQVRIGDPEKMVELGWFTEECLPDPVHSKFLDCFAVMKEQISLSRA